MLQHEETEKGRKYGGVCVYFRSGLPWKHRTDYERKNVECTWVELTSTVGKIIVGCVYRPPSSKPELWKDIRNTFAKVTDMGYNVVLTGDINCDQSICPNPFSHILSDCGLVNHNKHQTHVTPTSSIGSARFNN